MARTKQTARKVIGDKAPRKSHASKKAKRPLVVNEPNYDAMTILELKKLIPSNKIVSSRPGKPPLKADIVESIRYYKAGESKMSKESKSSESSKSQGGKNGPGDDSSKSKGTKHKNDTIHLLMIQLRDDYPCWEDCIILAATSKNKLLKKFLQYTKPKSDDEWDGHFDTEKEYRKFIKDSFIKISDKGSGSPELNNAYFVKYKVVSL